MTLTVVPTAYGRAASLALRDAVANAKANDPLAPVTVIVPTNSVGVAARRRIASGELGAVTSAGRGVVGITFLTVNRLAELLAAPALAAQHRRPVSNPIVASAMRRALASNAGLFAPVAAHPATEEALVAAHRELSDLDSTQLDELGAQHPRAREVVRLHRAAREILAEDWYDEHDLMAVATDAVRAGHPLVPGLGTIVCFLPQRWSAPAARLVHALVERGDVTVIAALTGVARADAEVGASLGRIGAKLDDTASAVSLALGTEVVSASDPDDEVRAVVRGLVDAMRAGVPLERMAVLYGADDPYARLVHEHLDLAGIPHNGASVRTLADSVLGRGLVRILELAEHDFTRDDICAFCAGAPVLDGRGQLVNAVAWDRLSRKAGVVRGLDGWRTRLDAFSARLPSDEFGRHEGLRVAALRAFVSAIAKELEAFAACTTWVDLARTAHRIVRRFFGDESHRNRWTPFEQEAARRVEAVVDGLATLDAVDRAPNADVFRRALVLELDAARIQVGRLGEGVCAGPVRFALGVDLDRVWVCGLAEGLFPSVPHDDPLLSDGERAVVEGSLRLRSDRVDGDWRALLAALASTSGPRVCSYPRGDLRRNTEHVPSRFLGPTLATVGAANVHTIASYAQAIARVEFPATEHELAVQTALTGGAWVPALPAVARGTELVAARAGADFTRFDGNLGALGERLRQISPAAGDHPISPTRLELWADCPHAFFMKSVLHVERVERPEDLIQLSPIDRGSIVHDILDRFLGETLERPDAGRPWTAADRARLREIADSVCAAAEARGITGRRLLWRRERRLILAELDAFLDADEKFRSPHAARTAATELAFGLPGASIDAVEIELTRGRRVRVRGMADRIDVLDDGTLVVIDYKTGSPNYYSNIGPENPIAAGTRLQLPIYAYAARRAFGAPDTPTEAWYWFVGKGENKLVGYPVDAAVDAEFTGAVSTIVDGIEAGVFFAVPPAPGPSPFVQCEYCDPDGLGTADVWREWERKHTAPELAAYYALDGEDEDAG